MIKNILNECYRISAIIYHYTKFIHVYFTKF